MIIKTHLFESCKIFKSLKTFPSFSHPHFHIAYETLVFCGLGPVVSLSVPVSLFSPPLWRSFLKRPLPAPVPNRARTIGETTDPKCCLQRQLLRSLGRTNTTLPHARCHFSPWLASFNITIFSWCLPMDDEALIAMPVPDES